MVFTPLKCDGSLEETAGKNEEVLTENEINQSMEQLIKGEQIRRAFVLGVSAGWSRAGPCSDADTGHAVEEAEAEGRADVVRQAQATDVMAATSPKCDLSPGTSFHLPGGKHPGAQSPQARYGFVLNKPPRLEPTWGRVTA